MAASSRTRSSSPVLSNAFQRSISPSGRLYSGAAAASGSAFSRSVRFSVDRLGQFSVADQIVKKPTASAPAARRKTCMCSPTSHPGSFRCSLHKGFQAHHHGGGHVSPANRLNARRSAMTNSLVRIGTVEGELVKRALTALIRPCAHHQRRRADFQPRPSRLSVMSKADDLRRV